MQRTLIVVDDSTWRLKLHELITDKKKVMIGFRSKTQMKSITTWLMNNHTNTQILKVDSDTSKEEMVRIFGDINLAVLNVDVFCFTSKLLTGADIQVPFDNVMFHAGSMFGPCPREAFQMMIRARKVVDSDIYVTLPQVGETNKNKKK